MRFSLKGLSVTLSLIIASSAKIQTPSAQFLKDIDVYARYASFGYCKHLVDGKVQPGTKVCASDKGIPNGCGELAHAVVVAEFPNKLGASGYVAVNDATKQIIVSFRGTGSRKDAFTDAKACKTRSRRFLGFDDLDDDFEDLFDDDEEDDTDEEEEDEIDDEEDFDDFASDLGEGFDDLVTDIGDTVGEWTTDTTNYLEDAWNAVADLSIKVTNEGIKLVVLGMAQTICQMTQVLKVDPKDRLLPFCDKCKVHQGFFEAFMGIKNHMFASVRKQKKLHPKYQIKVTGYSLGAAMATLSAAYLRKAKIKADLYTFGSPRVGNEAFAKLVSNQKQAFGKTFRITVMNDPVADVPWAAAGFSHIEPEYWFPRGIAAKQMHICTGVNNLLCSGRYHLSVSDVALGEERLKPHLWQSYAIGFPYTTPTTCPGSSR
ncbi:lipase [Metarhizium rileyi]|uniref:Lipase n=1 Tax=Metarhizium rileyi (strain RCEF 4871) TaxID=1649241 RepID=A0A166WDV0_METRR|nr:lipase [Metarhizium rileyi RCEF 4871]